jgi:AcrR family transcriptional regulator
VPTKTRSRRAENAERTRQALVDAALRLFASNGYDATSTDEIARAAGVSPRTFFRYFPTKETVLFFGEYDFVRSFADVFLAQPSQLSDLDAARGALILLAPGIGRLRNRIKLYERAIQSSLVLRGREQMNREEHMRALSDAFAQRRGLRRPDSACELLGAVCLLAQRRALEEWLRGPARRELGEVIAEEFTIIAREVHL